MKEISLFFRLGLEHILDLGAADHLLFLMALTVVFSLKDIKKLTLMVTLFTVAHTLSLALTAYRIVRVESRFIEAAIVGTIMITALTNILISDKHKLQKFHLFYVFFFGLIHGMGFTHAFLMSVSGSDRIFTPLLSFAAGIETGQILFILGFLIIKSALLEKLLQVKERILILSVSFFILGYALSLV